MKIIEIRKVINPRILATASIQINEKIVVSGIAISRNKNNELYCVPPKFLFENRNFRTWENAVNFSQELWEKIVTMVLEKFKEDNGD